MHFVVVLPKDEDAAFVDDTPESKGKPWPGVVNRGAPIKETVPPLTVTTSEEFGGKIYDAIRARISYLIVSQRFVDLLKSLGIKNVQLFPITVVENQSGEKYECFLCNVVGLIPCLDRKRADVDWDDDEPDKIFMLRRLAIDEKAIAAFNHGRAPEESLRIFRLEERPRFLLVDESLRKAALDAGLEGLEFRKPEECGDFR